MLFSSYKTVEVCYRLLRPDEDPNKGLFAKRPYSDAVSVEDHVTSGSKKGQASRYISCCKTLDAVKDFAKKSRNKRIVKITNKNGSFKAIDLTDLFNQMKYFPSNQKAKNYANRFQEVLILDFVPPECLALHKG
ncbi:uncharacterized protein LOC133183965 [Saccostrea echinata]|uniref:uncharacterized protein LOC133183965 n=1 Tax=Saccostrea echinata TaxID=191078 RepID=UPI002A7FE85C|nr:uncharacterized protein LOC133183965 [Saccostrea echinata]